MSKRIAIFNHKGGTGKTVSTYNIGWKLSQHNHNVLLVDGDSQVNLTALALGFERFDDYYDSDETKYKNIKDAVSPVFDGKPANLEVFDCPTAQKNDKLFILPGHPDLAGYEAQISLAQETLGTLSVMKNLPGVLHSFISMVENHHKIDYTLIDLNPGLGAINQNFFMASDSFIVPTNPDPFSLMAIETLGSHLIRWNNWKQSNLQNFSDADYPLYDSTPVFLGTLNSRFNKHASKAAKKFDERINKIDEKVSESLFPSLEKAGMTVKEECYEQAYNEFATSLSEDNRGKYALARIPDFQSLIHISTEAELPIFLLDEESLKKNVLHGSAQENAKKNIESFNEIFEAIASKVEILTGDDCRKD